MDVDEYRKFWNKIVCFVDEFNRNSNIILNPPKYKSIVANAYYAGLVEYLTNKNGIRNPDWVFERKYYLKEPFFPSGVRRFELRVLSMLESPIEFKSRNIFIGENTFNRC